MTELDDHELLAEYVRTESEAAFSALVARHVNLVYSAAMRFTGNSHHAEEITQAVFIILARKADGLRPGVVMSGWLYQTARLTSANFMKGEIRRQRREQEAYMQSTLNEPELATWEQITPLLDEAMGRLGETDRNAIVLRFFENKTAPEAAVALKLNEAAVHKRVNRAVEKLRRYFAKRGVASPTPIIAGAISANSVQAAPAMLAKAISAVAITKGAAASGSTLTLINGAMKLMAWTKMKMAVVASAGVLLAAGGGTAIYEIHRSPQNPSVATPATPDGPAEMKVNWMVGKTYAMRMELDQSTEPALPDPRQPKSEVNLAQDFDILPLKDYDHGGRQLQLEFKSEAIDVSRGGSKILSFDSAQNPAQDASNPLGPMLRLMIGTRLQYFIGADSKVEKVEGVDELMNRISGGRPQQQAMFKQIFGEDSLKQYASLGEWFPNRMVKVGESWPMKKDVNSSAGTLTVDMNYIFKNWEQHGDRKCAHIEGTGDISTKTISNASGVAIEIERGKISGDVWFDPELGMIVEANNNQNITMKVTAQAQTLRMQMTIKSRLTLMDVQ